MEDKLAALLAARQKQDSIWTSPVWTNPVWTNPVWTNPVWTNPDEKTKIQTASFSKKPEATSK